MRYKNSLLGIMQLLIVFVLFGMKLVPQFQYSFAGTFWSLAYQGIFCIWLMISVLRSGFWFRYLSKYLKNWLLWIVYLALTFLMFSNTQIGFFSLNLTFWEPMVVYFYYTEVLKGGEKEATVIAIVCMACLLFGLFQSIQSVNVNELAAREASSGHSSDDAVLTGNYSFTATLTILLPATYLLLRAEVRKIWKIFAVIFIGASFYFVIHCNLMISILCMFLSIPLIFVFGKNIHFDVKRLLLGLIITVIFAFTAAFWKSKVIEVLELFASVVGTKEIINKVSQLIYLLNGTLIGNVHSRFELCAIALNTFISHPIFGIGPQNNANIYFLTQLGLHATLFDDLARYGIVGISVMGGLYMRWYKCCVVSVEGQDGVIALKCGIVLYFIISMLNPTLSANIGIALFFVLPMLSKVCSRREIY